ncbi:MAG TPA: EamA family transporter [Chitinophagaceae bacterium]
MAFLRKNISDLPAQGSDSRDQLSAQSRRGAVATRRRAFFALAIVCFFWGTTWLGSKQGVKYMPALEMVGMRHLIAGICYVIFFTFKGYRWPRGRDWATIILLGSLNFLFSNGLNTWGVEYISAGLASIIAAVFPLWLVIINLFTVRAPLPRGALAGLLTGFAGVCIIFAEHLHDFLNNDFRFGIILSVIATWAWALGTIVTKQKASSFNPYFSLGFQMIFSGAVLCSTQKIMGSAVNITQIPWQAWAALAYLVSIGSIISFIAYIYALQHLPAAQTSIYAYINPVVAVIFGGILFGERLTVFIAIGGLVALIGVYLVDRAYKLPSTVPEAAETA